MKYKKIKLAFLAPQRRREGFSAGSSSKYMYDRTINLDKTEKIIRIGDGVKKGARWMWRTRSQDKLHGDNYGTVSRS
jgi:hypothetical protein